MIVNVQTGARIYNTETKTDNFVYKKGFIELKQEDAKNLLDIKPTKNENKKTTYIIDPNEKHRLLYEPTKRKAIHRPINRSTYN